ncbi:MAG: hypothetical protein IPF56_06380 [Chloroflexi bacterium]|nr:hypothetical protein [Chloroflexota bacterium]
MLTTPLLVALSNAFPQTRFDWVVSSWGRPAIIGNPRITELIDAGSGDPESRRVGGNSPIGASIA